jgi:hypothetical protein
MALGRNTARAALGDASVPSETTQAVASQHGKMAPHHSSVLADPKPDHGPRAAKAHAIRSTKRDEKIVTVQHRIHGYSFQKKLN